MATLSARSYGERRRELYGLDRNQAAREIKAKLTHSHVLNTGEYNFDIAKSREGIWKTSTEIDYRSPRPLTLPGDRVQVHGPARGKGQLKTHFDFGSSQDQPEQIVYHLSRTQQDYEPKEHSKPQVLKENRTVNWPDMAPQLSVHRTIGRSEYDVSFLDKALPPAGPAFPRINTSKAMLPFTNNQENFNRKVNVSLGSEGGAMHTETQRSYTAPAAARGGNLSLVDMLKHSTDISQNMLKMTRKSNVFRSGDYNNMKQQPGSTFTLDYSKRLATPNTVKMLPADDAENREQQENEDKKGADETRPPMPQLIGKFLKYDLDAVYKEASRGKLDQSNAHFQFGSDEAGQKSVYKKDFGKETRTKAKVTFTLPPQNSKVMQFDPALSSTGRTTTADAHVPGTFQLAIPANETQRQRTLVNLSKRHGNNVVISYDKDKHASDRQISMSHESYVRPPGDLRPVQPRKPTHNYNYVESDGALPFPVEKEKFTEAQNQFRPMGMDAESSRDRQMTSRDTNKSMREWGRATHFINGYVPMSFNTETFDLFNGKYKHDVDMRPAGVTEKQSDRDFAHHDHSVNTQDTQPEPNSKSQRMGAPLRAFPSMPTHKASIMCNDYTPLNNRKLTAAQEVMLEQSSKLDSKPIAASHFFHTDTSGGRNFTTTAMSDYIKPEMMPVGTPRTLTSVR